MVCRSVPVGHRKVVVRAMIQRTNDDIAMDPLYRMVTSPLLLVVKVRWSSVAIPEYVFLSRTALKISLLVLLVLSHMSCCLMDLDRARVPYRFASAS